MFHKSRHDCDVDAKHTFLQSCKGVVGDSNVFTEDAITLEAYCSSVSGEERAISGCVIPGSVKEVQKIVRMANEFQVSLYPISTGKNWGLGSALPVKSGAIILDLGRLNRIREVNTQFGYAVIEPGVTQRQLYEYLKAKQLPYMLDLTGSAAETSILGNLLEGGVGYFALRFEQSSGFEVVLGDGSMLETGYGHFDNSLLKHLHRYGVGPHIDGLFVQSNFGIVTALGISLTHIPEKQTSVICSLKNEGNFRQYIECLGSLRKMGVVRNNIKIGNYYRSKTTLCPLIYGHLKKANHAEGDISRALVEKIFEQNFGSWSAVIPVMGDKRYVKLVHQQIKEIMGNDVRIRIVDKRKLDLSKKITSALSFVPFFRYQHAVLCSVEPLFDLCRGVPTDATLPSLYWPEIDVPEDYMYPDTKQNVGMIAYLPMIPLDGKTMHNVQEKVTTLFESNGFIPNITITMISHKVMWGVIDMPFDRSNPVELKKAKQCITDLTRSLLAEGIIPQRIGIDYMGEVINSQDPYWAVLSNLKSIFDPNNILSPGRYSC